VNEQVHRVNTDLLPDGMYFIQVLVDQAVVTKKVMVTAR